MDWIHLPGHIYSSWQRWWPRFSPAAVSWIDGYTTEQLSGLQRQDPVLLPVHEWIDASYRPARDEATCGYCYQKLLDQTWKSGAHWGRPVPAMGRSEQEISNQMTTLGATEFAAQGSCMLPWHFTCRSPRGPEEVKRFHWPGLCHDVNIHIRDCKTCGAKKMPYKRFRAALPKFQVSEPMDRLGIDFMGPFYRPSKGISTCWW